MDNRLKLEKVDMTIEARVGKSLYVLFYDKNIQILKRYNKELETEKIIRFSKFDKLQIDIAIANLIRNIIDTKITHNLMFRRETKGVV